ncbi:MAG: YigZ family protein [Oceanobacter sp.]
MSDKVTLLAILNTLSPTPECFSSPHSMQSIYNIPDLTDPHTCELEIKRSQFITFLHTASNRQQADDFIREVRALHPQARHICWAYIAGAPDTTVTSMSDDGEPSGTAGRPMLKVLQHSGLGEVVVAVVRYFGGIKLGTGGLQRAYSDAVSLALDNLPTCKRVPTTELTIEFDYSHEATVRHLLSQIGGNVSHCDYSNGVKMNIIAPADKEAELTRALINQCSGALQVGRKKTEG